jgi:hypothetical protein
MTVRKPDRVTTARRAVLNGTAREAGPAPGGPAASVPREGAPR